MKEASAVQTTYAGMMFPNRECVIRDDHSKLKFRPLNRSGVRKSVTWTEMVFSPLPTAWEHQNYDVAMAGSSERDGKASEKVARETTFGRIKSGK